jgi:TetR/AcrR family transcriptional repressor of nem operon
MARPIKYSIDSVLEKAMLAFWRHGYQATSLEQLIAETGLGKSSLYNLFGGKRALYIQSLEFYANREVTAAVSILEQGGEPGALVGQLLNTVLVRISTNNDRLGCLLCNSALGIGASDAEIARQVRACLDPLQQAFSNLLQSAGFKPDAADSQAQQLLAIYTGVQVMSRAGYSTDVLKNIIDQTVAHLP